ncbi:MAG: PadR family transcriptional regulator [Pseudomonadota bacterium]
MNIRTLCLGILHFDEATGYEINKLASDGNFSHFIEASYGSIYPALTRLTKEGLVTWREDRQPGNPSRKIYAITDDGRSALEDALRDEPKHDIFKSEFLFLHLFSGLISRERLLSVTRQRTKDLKAEEQRMIEARDDCDHPGSKFALGYGLALTRAAIDYLTTTPVPQAPDANAETRDTPRDVPPITTPAEAVQS